MKSELDRREVFASAAAPRGAVIHLVGTVTDSVFSFLGPATAALAQQGVPQTVVLLDDPPHRHLLPKFHETVRLVLADAGGSLSQRLKGLLDAYCAAVHARRAAAAHVHGGLPLLIAIVALRRCGVWLPTYFSPHGSRLLGPLRALATPLLAAVRSFARRSIRGTIASNWADGRSLNEITQRPVSVVESPVAEVFLDMPLAPDSRPLVVACGRESDPVGAALVAQCAVLLADQLPGLRFVWLGSGDAESVARLQAAGVTLVDTAGDAARARAMAAGWLYLAPAGRGFPVFLAEAMTLGLPCVTWDTPYARDLVRDGVSGFLCEDTDCVLLRVAELTDSPSLRARLGAQAQREARERFGAARFRDSMLDLYGDGGVV